MEISKEKFKEVAEELEKLRKKRNLTSNESIFLGILRDIAFAVSNERWNRVVDLAESIETELKTD